MKNLNEVSPLSLLDEYSSMLLKSEAANWGLSGDVKLANVKAELIRRLIGGQIARKAIQEALHQANGRWSEWGGRAESTEQILTSALEEILP